MDTATLFVAHHVLAEGSIRGVARRLGRPPASVEAALARLEEGLSLPLASRAGTGLNLTFEARRVVGLTKTAAAIVVELHLLAGPESMRPSQIAVGLEPLARLAAIGQAGSIRKAARLLGIGQPQLTRQMRGLEAALGGPLLTRAADGARLTALGAKVVEVATRLQETWTELSARSGERFRRSVSTARFGSVMPLGHESQLARLLANLLARWQTDHPRQPLFISSTTADELLAGLKTGRFDVALLDTTQIPEDCEGVMVGETPLALVGAESLLDAHASIAQVLARAPIAVPSQRSGLRQHFEELIRDRLDETARRKLTIVEIDSIPVILNMVLQHGYVSLLPETSIANIREELGQVRLERMLRFWLVWPKTPAARLIGQAVAEVVSANQKLGPRAK